MMFDEGYQPEGVIYDWPVLAPLHPDFTHLSDSVVDNQYGNLDYNPWYWDSEPKEEVASNEFDPLDYIMDETEPEPMVTFPDDTNVSMLQSGSLMNLWENEPQLNLMGS